MKLHTLQFKKSDGSVTLYLSLTFTLILSLIIYTIESCHLDALTAHAEGVSYTSLDSLFGNYCLPLFEKYGLFCLNEQGLNLTEELERYAGTNCATPKTLFSDNKSFLGMHGADADITKVTYLTDNDGEIFVEQICDYVKYMELSSLADSLISCASTDYPDVYKNDENGTPVVSVNSIDTSSFGKYIPDSSDNDGETSIDLSDIDAKTFEDSITKRVGHIIKNGLLSFIVKDPETVSSLSIDKTVLPSVTCELSDEGINASYGYYKDTGDATYRKACFCEYISNTFNCYTDSDTDSALRYQMEYVVYGSPDDDVNLINCALQLITLRTGLNLIHLFTDKDKFNAAMKIAELAQAIPIPGSVYIAQMAILTVWATAEAVIDVRDLLSGKSVVLFKSGDEWNLSLEGLKNFSKNTPSTNSGDKGLSYRRYLEMLLAVQNNISVYYRTMDLIQMDICKEYSEDFRLSRCVSGIEASITYGIPFLILPKSGSYTCKMQFNYN